MALGAVGLAATAGCSVPSSLAASLEKLPDLPQPSLPDVPVAEFVGLAPEETPAASPAATATPTPGAFPSPDAGPTASPTSDVTALVVAKTGGDGVYLRTSIKPEKRASLWPDGTRMLVVGADKTVDKRTWKNVKDPDGRVGWVPAQYLMPAPRVVSAPKPGAASGTVTPGASSGTSPARWNVAEPDAFASGNVSLAAEQLRALDTPEIKGRARGPEPAGVLRELPRYYGTIVRLEGYVGQIQQAPADSSIADLLGVGVVHLLVSCRDGTLVDVFQLGVPGGARVGDLVAAYGLPAGQLVVEDRLAGPTTRLVVVTKLIERLSK